MTSKPNRSHYRELAEIPVYSSAHFIKCSEISTIRVTASVPDHLRNIKRNLVKHVFVTPSGSYPSPAHDISEVVASAVSPSGRLLAVLRDVQGSERKRYVEIWRSDKLVAHCEVTKVHKEFYADDDFLSLSFSPSETAFIYAAEANAPDPDKDSYEKFRFLPHFGERLPDRKRPTLFLMRWNDESSSQSMEEGSLPANVISLKAASVPASMNISFGQAVFSSDDRIYATGYEHTPDGRNLGISGCFNRPSGIWEFDLPYGYESTSLHLECFAKKLTSSDRSCRSPRIVRHGETLILLWLSHEVGGPHHSCAALHIFDLKTMIQRVLVDIVSEPKDNQFPGLYLDQLPAPSALTLDGAPFIVAHSIWGSRSVLLLISLNSGQVTQLGPTSSDYALHSWSVLRTDGQSRLICAASAPGEPNQLYLGKVSGPGNASWQVIDRPELSPSTINALKQLSCAIIDVPNRHPTQTILIQSNSGNKEEVMPCITWPHGGPHTTTVTAFSAPIAALALQGFSVSLPNYTGSLGYGEKYVKKIIGQCGTLDVEDCIESARHLISLGLSKAGPGYQFFYGGSHGGFLGAHLVGQYPDFFSAAALRNPVISVGEMISATDIPDWCYSELGMELSPATVLSPKVFDAMYRASPIAHVDAVTSPVLLLLGEQDHRVPPIQGKIFYHALKGRQKAVDTLWFPGAGHSLDNIESARHAWEATMDWFKKYRT